MSKIDYSSTREETKNIKDEGKLLYSYTLKATQAQYAATFVVSITYFGVGILCVMNTIVVGNLLHATDDVVSLDEDEGSWFGSLPCLVQPIGAFAGILLQDFVGQRWSLMLTNVFALISLILLYCARTTMTVLISGAIIGLSLGFTEPSGIGYISEYSEPRLRGSLCAGTLFMASVGNFFMLFFASVMHWRTAVLMSALIPALAILLLFWIPDSPVWLLSRGKHKKALKALTWLRGWTTEDNVREEFEDMRVFVKKSLTAHQVIHDREENNILLTTNQGQEKIQRNQSTLKDLMMSILERRTLYPLFIICILMVINSFASSAGARTYMMNLFDALHTPIDKYWMAISVGLAMVAGNLFVTLMMKYTGKRPLTLVSVFMSSIISILLCLYVNYKDQLQRPWILIFLFFLLNIVTCLSSPIPWLMMGEVFPVRTRNAGSGLGGAIFDLIIFLFLKTYFTVDRFLGTELFFMINGVVGIVGCLYLYYYMPETEGKTLAQIEEIFVKKPKTLSTYTS